MSVIVAIIEGDLRRYLTGCEYMQIDPSIVHDSSFISERAETILSQWGGSDDQRSVKTIRKELGWLVRQYDYLTKSGLLGHDFAGKCAELIRTGKLRILPGTVNERYIKKEPLHGNYDLYAKAKAKAAWFAVIMAAAIICSVAIIAVIFN
jgi:hypothetical protein